MKFCQPYAYYTDPEISARHAKIYELAGDDTIIINAGISLVKKYDDISLEVGHMEGGILRDSVFESLPGYIFKLRGAKEPKNPYENLHWEW